MTNRWKIVEIYGTNKKCYVVRQCSNCQSIFTQEEKEIPYEKCPNCEKEMCNQLDTKNKSGV